MLQGIQPQHSTTKLAPNFLFTLNYEPATENLLLMISPFYRTANFSSYFFLFLLLTFAVFETTKRDTNDSSHLLLIY